MKDIRVIISGGGTGGHIFPAISIANAIKERFPEAKILFVGAEGRMEMKRVPAAGYQIVGLPVAGFNRKNLFKNIKVLWKLRKSLRKAEKIIKEFNPQIAIGVGGYASGPLLKTAAAKGVPTLLQEQNSYAGVTNKLLAKTASAICVAYEGMERFFPADKIVLTGNPCRQDLLSSTATRKDAIEFFKLDPDKKTILIIGGSLGARTINLSFLDRLDKIGDDVQVVWQSGEYYFHDLFVTLDQRKGHDNIHLYDFINRMDLAYKAADLVISRAGAGSISEQCLLGKPVILVPSPNVAEDHQTQNALALVKKDAAIMVKDADAQNELVKIALETVADDEKLKSLSANILKLAQHDSANRIVDEVVKILNKKQ
ncbi:UDP-N-acetylglucosamine--N-acetylmuramyl-(pentapeptide) pyrophosphoryl-undecaprenol N-acetylglucosamine transferase [Dysgonomonas sp. PH5-45]|uniref:undecaprenyldiphospho-muramoylpentapeptide beta-N-acetylglucosaminyltransferase n=1 Tax=unclassified Dysgonomonas TaxID=2630389 RepID=UPI00247610A9|nr:MULTISPECIES: undecaprenyldiphospho-muramoylpentapeptide beta-N-acetylglucosaminyltransferase [unclassified Dysgonomonas]MDH6355719.1 UDP-N-acetylglucosamine--N-acetylmuramyl-(pentapeptide) pyrophosphoryl-undecaprenol N-acetylglucosamine transferase [Dysgonomonas sp. PH5-45]MDH6388616.1 UDP-N-acetylglucosamine--N-acetylmuramyl-(pentapeptide) pyrophosphoryl-undecaprenol N-acetylglucosamine transferase [Dysgonomonas sp. PH5-37]